MVKDNAYANRMEILGHEGDPIHYNYYKYISVVPHIFVDTSTPVVSCHLGLPTVSQPLGLPIVYSSLVSQMYIVLLVAQLSLVRSS